MRSLACILVVALLAIWGSPTCAQDAPAGLDRVRKAISEAPAGSQRVIFATRPRVVDAAALGVENASRAVRRSVTDLATSLGARNVAPLGETEYVVAEVTLSQLEALSRDPSVVAVYIDEAVPPVLDQAMPVIHAPDAHRLGADGKGLVVAILDTGVDVQHPFLENRIAGEACFSSNTSDARSLCPNGGTQQLGAGAARPCTGVCSHGTHVAGIAAGANRLMTGAAPEARILAVQVFSLFSSGDVKSYTSDQIRALDYIYNTVTQSQRVASINLSLGGPGNQAPCPNNPMAAPIARLRAIGVATVIAAGNDGAADAVSSPGCVPDAITVAASSNSDIVAIFSNSGEAIDVVAPGVSINSSVPNGAMARMSGTSMATPVVAGSFAALQSFRLVDVGTIESALESTGVPLPLQNPVRKRPRVDLLAATNRLDSLIPAGAFVWMRDTWSDTGAEPDPATAAQSMSGSPAIWVRLQNDCDANNREHQNPELGQVNYICVEVRNAGKTAGKGKLRLYYASANLDASASWTPISDLPLNVPAKQSAIVSLPWGALPAAGHFCLLAQWVDQGKPDALQLPGGINAAVRNSNDLVWHNINIVDAQPNPTPSTLRFEPGQGGTMTIAVEIRALDPRIKGALGALTLHVPGRAPHVRNEPTSALYNSDGGGFRIPLQPGVYYIPDIERPAEGAEIDLKFETLGVDYVGDLMSVQLRNVTDLPADKAGKGQDAPAVTYIIRRAALAK